jgi:signal transduction histidine kinase
MEILDFVSTALSQDKFSGLSAMLRTIAEGINAYGCVLWQVTPGSKLNGNSQVGYLFALAEWFQDDRTFVDYLPITSVTGEAIAHQETISITDVYKETRIFHGDPFLQQMSIQTLCSVPITLLDGARGALNLYRKDPTPFTDPEVERVKEIANLIPILFQTISDKISLQLIQRITGILHESDRQSPEVIPSKTEIKSILQRVCNEISKTFQCVEASIFLEDYYEATSSYEPLATTWPDSIKPLTYEKYGGGGITGWILANLRSVNIFDLAHFDRDKEVIQHTYPGLDFTDSISLRSRIRQFLNLAPDDTLPPLSYMATPVISDRQVQGILRCCIRRESPYYFSDRELNILTLVAAEIGQYWHIWLNRREVQQENESWRIFIQSIARLNSFAHNELIKERPDELNIFAEALKVASNVIEEAGVMDIRLLDEQKGELYFAITHGQEWNNSSGENHSQSLTTRRFTVRGDPQSAGAYVFRTGKPYIIPDVENSPFYSEMFPGTKRLIIAPISVEEEIFGILDIRGTGERDFPKNALSIATLLGQQLGLYYHLATTIRKLRAAEADLKSNIAALQLFQEQQAETFEDLEHQLKGPIIQAYARIESVLSSISKDDKFSMKLRAIRGLCGKAKRVAMSTGIFSRLVRDEPIKAHLKQLRHDDLIKMVIEIAIDHQLMIDPARNIRFEVDRKSFEVLRTITVNVDYALLEQSVSNILDNAGKYSYPETIIEIYGGCTTTGRFHISVANRGVPIRSTDIKHSVERGWRSETARQTTGEGTGIGLWIVDHIMKAHGGELIISPTGPEHRTEVRLVFPSSNTG